MPAAAVITNKFAKHCSACGVVVPQGAGVSLKETGDSPWLTYCDLHAPEMPRSKTVTTPAPMIRREITEDGKVYIQPWTNNADELALLRSMPGREYHPDGRYWQVNMNTGADRQEVRRIATLLRLQMPASLLATVHTTRAVEAGLYNYQVEGVDWLHQEVRRLLADDMGLGKTIEVIMALNDDDAVIIICPATVKYNWHEEFAVWRPNFKVEVMVGQDSFRWPGPGEAIITSYGTLPSWLMPKAKTESIVWSPSDEEACRKTTLIADEAHAVKNVKTMRHMKVSQLSEKAKKVWFLTGTPLTNKAKDLIGVLKCLKVFGHVFGNFNNFVQRFNVLHNGYGYDWETARPDREVPLLMQKVMLRRTREEVLPDLPKIQYQTLSIDSGNERLTKMLDKCWMEYESWFDEHNRLPKFEDFSKIRKALATARIPAMIEFIENVEEQDVPLVVFSAHREPIDRLKGREGWAVITGDTPPAERHEIVQAAKRGVYKGVGCTIGAGAEGISLVFAWTALFIDLDWNPSKNEQAERRLLRIGQESDKIRVIHMVSNHPLDKRVYQLITGKNKLHKGVLTVR